MTEHIHSDAPTQLTDVTDRAARIAAVLSSTDERWAEASMLLRNLVAHYSCGGGKTQAVLTNMGFDSLRGVFEADLEELAAEQDRELATRETAELLALAFLTEMSSLGSAGARRLRNNTSYADLAKIMCRVDRDDEARGWSVAGAEATNAAEPVAVGDDPGSHEADCTHHDRRRDQRPLRVPRKDRAIAGVTEAFEEFQSRLKITEAERKSATRRQQILRGQLDRRLDIDAVFLTGSYVRDTKIKPLCDIDMMVVLKDRSYLGRHPHDVLDVVRAILVPHHGSERLTCSRRSVRVDFSAAAGDDEGDEVTGFEVVPAFKQGDCYWIPDRALAEWVSTNPQVHAQRATTANEAFSDQWKPLVKMLKTCREAHPDVSAGLRSPVHPCRRCRHRRHQDGRGRFAAKRIVGSSWDTVTLLSAADPAVSGPRRLMHLSWPAARALECRGTRGDVRQRVQTETRFCGLVEESMYRGGAGLRSFKP